MTKLPNFSSEDLENIWDWCSDQVTIKTCKEELTNYHQNYLSGNHSLRDKLKKKGVVEIVAEIMIKIINGESNLEKQKSIFLNCCKRVANETSEKKKEKEKKKPKKEVKRVLSIPEKIVIKESEDSSDLLFTLSYPSKKGQYEQVQIKVDRDDILKTFIDNLEKIMNSSKKFEKNAITKKRIKFILFDERGSHSITAIIQCKDILEDIKVGHKVHVYFGNLGYYFELEKEIKEKEEIKFSLPVSLKKKVGIGDKSKKGGKNFETMKKVNVITDNKDFFDITLKYHTKAAKEKLDFLKDIRNKKKEFEIIERKDFKNFHRETVENYNVLLKGLVNAIDNVKNKEITYVKDSEGNKKEKVSRDRVLLLESKIIKIEAPMGNKVKVIDDNFEYHLIPNEITLEVRVKKKGKNHTLRTKLEVLDVEHYKMDVFDLKNMILFYAGYKLSFAEIDDVVEDLKKVELIDVEYLIEKLRNAMIMVCSKREKIPSGIVFKGPPGTGKSTIMKKLIQIMKCKLACRPLSSGDFEKGYKGESETLINHLVGRASFVPWKLVVLAIDEIEDLVPERKNLKGDSGKGAIISVILKAIGGIADADNFLVLASTNFADKMDQAVLRRFNYKFFVGKPGFNGRMMWVNKYRKKYNHLKKLINKKMVFDIAKLTINFSHSSMEQLLQHISSASLYDMKKLPNFKFDMGYISDFIIEVIVMNPKMGLKLGKFILPNIIQPIPDEKKKKVWDLYQTFRNEKFDKNIYTHRILIDLQRGLSNTIQIECKSPKDIASELQKKKIKNSGLIANIYNISERCKDRMNKFEDWKDFKWEEYLNLEIFDNIKNRIEKLAKIGKKENVTQKKKEIYVKLCKMCLSIMLHRVNLFYFQNEDGTVKDIPIDKTVLNSSEDVICLFVDIALSYKYDCIKVFDHTTLISNNIVTQEQIKKFFHSQIEEEAKEYDKSIVIFDLDSLSSVVKQYSGFKEDMHYSSSSLTTAGDFGPTFTYNLNQVALTSAIINLSSNRKKCWFVCFSSHPLIVEQFKDALKWPKTKSDLKIKHLENENKKDQKPCIRCGKVYKNIKNTLNSCSAHILNKLYLEDFKKDDVNKKTYKYTTFEQAKEKIKMSPHLISEYKYLCCGRGINEKGGVPCKHTQKENERHINIYKKK